MFHLIYKSVAWPTFAALLTTIAVLAVLPVRAEAVSRLDPTRQIDDWRRTQHGWERARTWPGTEDSSQAPATPHPVLFAALLLLLSIAALYLLSKPTRPVPAPATVKRRE